MTMDLAQAEEQNRDGWLANTPCAAAPSVLHCIYNLSAAEVMAAIPPLWAPATYFPLSPAGNNYPGVVIVDGVTVAMPLLDALSVGLVDVPLILTTMRDVRVWGGHLLGFVLAPGDNRLVCRSLTCSPMTLSSTGARKRCRHTCKITSRLGRQLQVKLSAHWCVCVCVCPQVTACPAILLP
jgi:hypothetical protein